MLRNYKHITAKSLYIDKTIFICSNLLLMFFCSFLYLRVEPIECEEILLDEGAPVIFAITPAYSDKLQLAELTRLSQVLISVPNLHWIVVEDVSTKSAAVESLLKDTGISHTHLATWTAKPTYISFEQLEISKGMAQRNEAIKWLLGSPEYRRFKNSVVYFMDLQHTYPLKLFEGLRNVTKVGVWAVGLTHGRKADVPIINSTTKKVIGFRGKNMNGLLSMTLTGFAVHFGLMVNSHDPFFHYNRAGMQEVEFFTRLNVKSDDLQPLMELCEEIMVWETKTRPFVERNFTASTVMVLDIDLL